MKTAKFLGVFIVLFGSAMTRAGAAPNPGTPYDPNPAHVWNRLHDALFIRTAPDGQQHGRAELDILYWGDTQYLLTPPAHENAIRVLEEFISGHGERLIRDPLKRALLQRDLWQLFDWSASHLAPPASAPVSRARMELQRRLVIVIQRLALTAEEIGTLPDNYAEAESRLEPSGIPRGLFAADSPWLLVGRSDGPTAREHASGFGGRSVFLVYVKLPGGREPALHYLKGLREFAPALVYENVGPAQSPRLRTNPATPQFPAKTQWALVRRMNLIDDRGDIHASRLIESIQARIYDSIPDGGDFNALRKAQTVAEFQLDRARLPALRAVETGEREFQFVHFRSQGVDPLEHMSAEEWGRERDRIQGETLRTCAMCHQSRGILSVNTYTSFGMAANPLDVSTEEVEGIATREWKRRQYNWGLLIGLWPR